MLQVIYQVWQFLLLNTILQCNIEEYLAIFANIVQHMLIFITIRFILAISNSFICQLKILSRFYYFETFCLVIDLISRTRYRGAYAPKNNFGSKKIFDKKSFLTPKTFYRVKFFCIHKTLWLKKNLWVKKIFCRQTFFEVKKFFLGQKNV